ncbi:hypothetical protein Asera_30750 [Actinocatenispora sera]|uniref:Uncharacterized protein n=1 Tax=Actinocatenispora sera TaxID=390989 RepID=A0A810L193_9ACTN|nr:hypothetical protein Asera_30750 [Actinocatenispora sera]
MYMIPICFASVVRMVRDNHEPRGASCTGHGRVTIGFGALGCFGTGGLGATVVTKALLLLSAPTGAPAHARPGQFGSHRHGPSHTLAQNSPPTGALRRRVSRPQCLVDAPIGAPQTRPSPPAPARGQWMPRLSRLAGAISRPATTRPSAMTRIPAHTTPALIMK